MQCVILAGGIGTRMWPETRTVPKTLLPVLGRPFADWQLEWLAAAGIDSVVYCIGYLGDDVRAYVGDGSRVGARRSRTSTRASSCAAPPARCGSPSTRACWPSDFLVLYGDSWLQVDPADGTAQLRERPRAGADDGVPQRRSVGHQQRRSSTAIGSSATRRGWPRGRRRCAGSTTACPSSAAR